MNTDDYPIRDFDLQALMGLGDLNMHRLASTVKNLTIGEYFKRLSKFLGFAPEFSGVIKRFVEKDADTKDRKKVETMITLFMDIGCDRFIADLYAISDAHGKGDYRLTAFLADKLGGFDELYKSIDEIKPVKEDKRLKPSANLFATLNAMEEERYMLGNEKDDPRPLVLVVDDSPAILEAVATVLNSMYKVFKLPKPMMLENILKQMTPRMFLLDYQMPERNGFECMLIIRSIRGHEETPIIFLTSEGTLDNVSAAVALGACDFIVKPFKPGQLKEKVVRHMQKAVR
jgi:CheY-like chemotaxis protein